MSDGLSHSKLNVIFHPKSIAVVGASTRPGTVGNEFSAICCTPVQWLGVPGQSEGQQHPGSSRLRYAGRRSPVRWTWPC